MAEVVFVVNVYERRFVRSKCHVAVSEDKLQEALQLVQDSLNPLDANAIELRDYIDGRGELAVSVELAGKHKIMRQLLERISHIVAMECETKEEVEVLQLDTECVEAIGYERAYVRLGPA